MHSKGNNLLEDEKTNNSRDASPIVASVASMESKFEQLTTIVKSAQKVTSRESPKSGTQPSRSTQKKLGGPATSSAGPFNKVGIKRGEGKERIKKRKGNKVN